MSYFEKNNMCKPQTDKSTTPLWSATNVALKNFALASRDVVAAPWGETRFRVWSMNRPADKRDTLAHSPWDHERGSFSVAEYHFILAIGFSTK